MEYPFLSSIIPALICYYFSDIIIGYVAMPQGKIKTKSNKPVPKKKQGVVKVNIVVGVTIYSIFIDVVHKDEIQLSVWLLHIIFTYYIG